MRRIGMLTVLASLLVAAFCLNCYATDPSAEITALERHAERVQAQIDAAKAQSASTLNQQIENLKAQVKVYVGQRVQIDALISQLESQMDKLKKENETGLSRQVQIYNGQMSDIKQQLTGLISKQKASSAALNKASIEQKLKEQNPSQRIKTTP
ncbi:MAG: hypothetical protein AB1646_11890 [Thermodesulfobacteriota bacterium]